jgi:8-oxo-dGTP pyrophosphatase MutT (NUDIX family)
VVITPGDGHDAGVDRVDVRRRVRVGVLARAPVDTREAAAIRTFVELFDGLDDPFRHDVDPVHVTGSGIVVGPRGVVLLKHRRLGLWLQPGGHIDPGETPWEAAARECREETGLDVSFAEIGRDGIPALAHVDVHAGGRGHTHLDLRYLFDGGVADPDPAEDESQEIGWFGWDEAIDIADAGLRGALTWLNRSVVRRRL